MPRLTTKIVGKGRFAWFYNERGVSECTIVLEVSYTVFCVKPGPVKCMCHAVAKYMFI